MAVNVEEVLERFRGLVKGRLGFLPRKYQLRVGREVLEELGRGHEFVVVSMPTGSGKTLVEMLIAFYGLVSSPDARVLVLEPTRFLCDQMYGSGGRAGPWRALFGGIVGREYEGDCTSFLDEGRRIVISTPQTALKCLSQRWQDFRVVIVDEVHHLFGKKYYAELLEELKPGFVTGFTALLPAQRRYRLDPRVKKILGAPRLLVYDFKRLREIDPGFDPPRAIADVFDAEMDELENRVYEAFFRGLVYTDPRLNKFFETTLASYGRRAFCESYRRGLEKGRITPLEDAERLCSEKKLSHKARVLVEILEAYSILGSEGLRPVLIYTSRKASAKEFGKAVIEKVGVPPERVVVLTSDMGRDERRRVLERAKKGEVDVIVSTLVGEEGIDIPEAGLLVMTDVPRSPLRFYQRLGRLIRVSSPSRIKYLAVSLTPGTTEYNSLGRVLMSLYGEGVDVSYIIVNIDEKTLAARTAGLVEKLLNIYGLGVPYAVLVTGREVGDPIEYIARLILGDEEARQALETIRDKWGLSGDWYSLVFYLVTTPIPRMGAGRKLFRPVDRVASRGRVAGEISQTIREGRLLYIYDVEALARLMAHRLQSLHDSCKKGNAAVTCLYYPIRLDRKSVLRLITRLFPPSSAGEVLGELERLVEESRKGLEEAKTRGDIREYRVTVWLMNYNEKAKTLPLQLTASIETTAARLGISVQVNYYDIDAKHYQDDEKRELVKENLLAAGYRALYLFVEGLREQFPLVPF